MSIPPLGFVAGLLLPPTIPLSHRKDKTHGDNANKAHLATWSLSHKRAWNTLVKANNKDRLDKHAELRCSSASSLASLLTTEGSQDTPTLPTSLKNSLTKFLQALAKITPKLRKLISGFLGLKNKRPRNAADNSPEEVMEKHKKIFDCIKEATMQSYTIWPMPDNGVHDVAWAKHWKVHFFFFHDLVNFSLIYEVVLATDIKLHIDYHNSEKGFNFSQQYYASELSQTKEHIWDKRDYKCKKEYTCMHNQLAAQQGS
ncbi:hypothetical protein EDD85DRAFT_793794 [Armillaria nabsnona]|nr:hypothetical protein EDD85DRAFT_793794 [Armillaria nabsnona]